MAGKHRKPKSRNYNKRVAAITIGSSALLLLTAVGTVELAGPGITTIPASGTNLGAPKFPTITYGPDQPFLQEVSEEDHDGGENNNDSSSSSDNDNDSSHDTIVEHETEIESNLPLESPDEKTDENVTVETGNVDQLPQTEMDAETEVPVGPTDVIQEPEPTEPTEVTTPDIPPETEINLPGPDPEPTTELPLPPLPTTECN